MALIKTIIVDDEKDSRKGIKGLLSEDREIQVVGSCKNGLEAISEINKEKPDLIFLDIQMPQINGFEVLNNLQKSSLPKIIFVTAFDQYALKAFEFHAIDYLLKPFTDNRFFKALNHAKKQIVNTSLDTINNSISNLLDQYNQSNDTQPDTLFEVDKTQLIFKNKIIIRSSGKIHFVSLIEIEWIEAFDYYVKIHVKGKYHLLRETMTNMERRLPANMFIRIHKSSIVNIEQILEMEPGFSGNYKLKLKNGKGLTISASYFKKMSALFK